MLANKFYMRKRIMDGVSVKAYELADTSGVVYRYTKEETEQLALRGVINGVKAQRCNGVITMKGKDGFKIKDIETINIRQKEEVDMRSTLVRKIKIDNNREIVGYVLQNYDSSLDVRTSSSLIELATMDKIKNIRINKSGDKMIVRGVNCNLNDIPTIKLSQERFMSLVQKTLQTDKIRS